MSFKESLDCDFSPQDGVCSPEDVDTVMTQALGLRYSVIGPFETMHLNAAGEL